MGFPLCPWSPSAPLPESVKNQYTLSVIAKAALEEFSVTLICSLIAAEFPDIVLDSFDNPTLV